MLRIKRGGDMKEYEEPRRKKINPILRRIRIWKFRKYVLRHYAPIHAVVETDKAVYIDRKRIHHVLVPDGVEVEELCPDHLIITLRFCAKSYRKIT